MLSVPSISDATSAAGKVAVHVRSVTVALRAIAVPAASASVTVAAVTPGCARPLTTRAGAWLTAVAAARAVPGAAWGAYVAVSRGAIGRGVAPASKSVCSPPALAGAAAGPVHTPRTDDAPANARSLALPGIGHRAVQR